jgi:RNA recognition motif-containing protein
MNSNWLSSVYIPPQLLPTVPFVHIKTTLMNIFVGNLNKKTTAHHLFQLFLQFGKVISVRIAMDNQTGYSLGCGYIEMDSQAGSAAIQNLHERFFMNTYMEVNEISLSS